MCRKFFKDVHQEHRAKSFCRGLDELCMKHKMTIKEPFTLIDTVHKEVVGEDMVSTYDCSLEWYKCMKEREASI